MIKKKTKTKVTPRAGPVAQWWLQDQFDQLHREHNLILGAIKKMNISSDLEAAINRASTLSRKIDEQVPDKNVPPNKTKKKGK